MKCKHCNGVLDPQSRYCSYCGCEVPVGSDTRSPNAKSKSRVWIRLLIVCVVAVVAFSLGMEFLTTDPALTIEEQLVSLRAGHYTEAYYNYTSKSFQDSVTLDNFRKFILNDPAFATLQSVKILNKNVDANLGSVVAVLSTGKGSEVPIHYRLIKEGNRWKILSIRFEDPTRGSPGVSAEAMNVFRSDIAEGDVSRHATKASAAVAPFDPSPLYEVIQNQVDEAASGNIEKAYTDYTSADFRKTTSLALFSKFVSGHSGFVDNKGIEFGKLEVENNVVTVSGTLTDKRGHVYPFNYSLIGENGGWKILHIEVLGEKTKSKADNGASEKKGMIFEKFSVGTKVNGEGLITDPLDEFEQNAGQIHLNLFLKNAIAGTQVEVHFKHVNSGAKAPVAVAKVPGDGDVVLFFVFSPPQQGWPKGKYVIDAQSSSDVHGSTSFEVE